MLTKKVLYRLSGTIIVFAAFSFLGLIGYSEISDTSSAHVSEAISQQAIQVGQAKNADYYGAKRAELAMQEYQRGVVESNPGCNCGADISKYTEGNDAQWCTMFASWITKEAGSPVKNPRNGSWRLTNSRDLVDYLKTNGTWYSREEVVKNNLQPKMGDFIIYWRGTIDDGLGHVDIVVNPGATSGYAEAVGGNIRDRVVLRDFPFRDNFGFLGFGRPEKM